MGRNKLMWVVVRWRGKTGGRRNRPTSHALLAFLMAGSVAKAAGSF